MRWDDLFSDLAAQASELVGAEQEGEVAERTRMEIARLGYLDRLVPAVDSTVTLKCRGGITVSGRLCQVSPQWLLVDEGAGREAIVLTGALMSVLGLGRLSRPPGGAAELSTRLGLSYALRGVARDRSVVRLCLTDGSVLDGAIDRVGADFVEIAVLSPGELRRREEVRQVAMVLLDGLAVVRRDE